MRIFVAAIFTIAGVPLLLSAVSTLAASPSVDQQTVAMMQVIAGLLCFLIAVVAALMRPSERAATEAPRPAPPQAALQPAAAAAPPPARDGWGMGVLVVLLAVVLIALATWLRKPGPGKDVRALLPVPSSGSASAPARSTAPAVLPAGGTTMKPHAPSRTRRVSEDD
jgi:formate hydrogenlyase subunit 3/multisubunit Na+/H+ antiporter MnhD subunit